MPIRSRPVPACLALCFRSASSHARSVRDASHLTQPRSVAPALCHHSSPCHAKTNPARYTPAVPERNNSNHAKHCRSFPDPAMAHLAEAFQACRVASNRAKTNPARSRLGLLHRSGTRLPCQMSPRRIAFGRGSPHTAEPNLSSPTVSALPLHSAPDLTNPVHANPGLPCQHSYSAACRAVVAGSRIEMIRSRGWAVSPAVSSATA